MLFGDQGHTPSPAAGESVGAGRRGHPSAMSQSPDEEHEDQDTGPGSQPTGAAAEESPTEDQDAGPASVPDGGADDPEGAEG